MADQHNQYHMEDEEEWNPEKYGGMTKEMLREYADKLDLEIRQMPLDDVFDAIQTDTHVLFFGAVDCPHTQQFTAIWLNMQYALDFYYPSTPSLSVAKVQCAHNPDLCFYLMRDKAYPTIVLYHKGVYVKEILDRDHVWEFVEESWKQIQDGTFSDTYAGEGSVVEAPVHLLNSQRLEQEAVGGKVGLLESVLPVSLVCTFIGVFLVAAYFMRKSSAKGSKGKYERVGDN